MKKNLLNLGKVLTKTEQRLISGGLTDLRKYDEICDEAAEGNKPHGCGCSSDSECGFNGIPNPDDWQGGGSISGKCRNGYCA